MTVDEIGVLVDNCGDEVFNFCVYLTRDRQDAEDLLQQTFLRAVELAPKIDKAHNPKSSGNLYKIKETLTKERAVCVTKVFARKRQEAFLPYSRLPNVNRR